MVQSVDQNLKVISKLLSQVLRHKPQKLGLKLDKQGYADVTLLLNALTLAGHHIDLETLQEIVETNDKKRFAFNEDKTKIRASQGHSFEVELNLESRVPPFSLYHGTSNENYKLIQKSDGIKSMNRQHVHLSFTEDVAVNVGRRKGNKTVILEIAARRMYHDGYHFYCSENGVWLTDEVPFKYIVGVESVK